MALAFVLGVGGSTAWGADDVDFDRDVAPLLVAKCFDCHSGADAKGELDLTRREVAGAKPSLLVGGKADESELWLRVDSDEMPPKKPLEAAEKHILKRWIEQGAKWGASPVDPFRFTTKYRAGYDWWSLKPVVRPQVPAAGDASLTHPVDRFIVTRLTERGLGGLNPEADRRVLIRRLTFDLLGLPPAPEDVERFVADVRPDAYERLVDQLLASPHYGERQARHWLDVLRFGETDGFERNTIRPNAWPFRDWLIRAFNADLPYDHFVRMQMAGDLLFDGQPIINDEQRADGVRATGALVAGVHNTVLGNDEMRALARQDELEDLLGSVGQTFLGLTLNCARCHDHKFDPITQTDYYRMTASLAGVQHGERALPRPEVERRLAAAREILGKVRRSLDEIDQPVREAILRERTGNPLATAVAVQPLAAWDFRTGLRDLVGSLHCEAQGEVRQTPEGVVLHGRVAGGSAFLRTAPLVTPLGPKTLEAWVRLADDAQRGGGVMSVETPDGAVFDAIVYGENEPKRWMAGSNGFVRTQPFKGTDETEAVTRTVQVAIVYEADGTITGYRDGAPYGQPYKSVGLQPFAPEKSVVLFGCRHEPAGGNRMWGGTLVAARLYNRPLTGEEVRRAHGSGPGVVSEADVVAKLPEPERARRTLLKDQWTTAAKDVERLQGEVVEKVYATTVGKIGPVHLLSRGELKLARGEVMPGTIASVHVTGFPELTADATDAQRRLQLARWITAPKNPLFARVMVNRLWHHHFGTGIVDTPNDFGFNGGRPTHPELLDWLAAELVSPAFGLTGNGEQDAAWRLKRLHRLIVTSAAYRQGSQPRENGLKADAESRLLWRKPTRRLDAEQLRDAMLAVSGMLDRSIGGKGFSDYKDNFLNGTTYFEPFDNETPEARRRSIYRFLPRGANPGLLDAFDCPDPAAAAPRRAVTTTPLQALSLWNNGFSLRCADALAARAVSETAALAANQQAAARVQRVWGLVFQRLASEVELRDAVELVGKHDLATLCRALLNSNEFLVVE